MSHAKYVAAKEIAFHHRAPPTITEFNEARFKKRKKKGKETCRSKIKLRANNALTYGGY